MSAMDGHRHARLRHAQRVAARIALTGIALGLASPAHAQSSASYGLSWNVLAGGGGSGSSGGYRLGDTIAQAVAGPLASGTFGLGAGFWQPLDDQPTAVLASLLSASGSRDGVDVTWAVERAGPVVLDRAAGVGAAWQPVATRVPDGTGRVAFHDTDVRAAGRYGYRLRWDALTAGEVWVDVPALALAILPLANPAAAPLTVTCTLPSREPARLELLDTSGRRVWVRALGASAAGATVSERLAEPLPAGVYVLHLTQGTRVASRKLVIRR